MSFSATQKHRKAKAWSRSEGKDLRIKRLEDVPSDKTKGFRVKSLKPSQSTSGRLVPVAPPLPDAVPIRNASLASAAPSYVQERHYSRPLPEDVTYSRYPVSAVSNPRSPAITNANPTTSSRTPSVAHNTYSTPAASVVSAAKSQASTVSGTQDNAPGNYHPHPPQAVSIPSQGPKNSHASSVVRATPSTAPESPLLLPAPRERSRASSGVSVTPSTASGKYPALPASRDSSRASSVISAVQGRVPESHPLLTESRVQNYRAPSVISVASSTVSVQHPPLFVSEVPSEIQNPQLFRSQSVASAAQSTVREDRLLLPASGSRSPSVAPSEVSFIEESSGYLQESQSRDPSRASSSRALALRAPSSQPPVSHAASVTPTIRSEHAVCIPSAARRDADEVYGRSEVGNRFSVAESSTRSRRPSVVHRDEEHADQVPLRAPSIAASTRSSIKSGRNERNISTASKARSRIYEEDYESTIQSKSTSKRASSIKPPSRSERGDSTASKARRHIEVDDYESSSEREPTSRRASSKASSSRSARKASRDGRGRSTASRTESAYDELAEVRVTYDEHEGARTKGRPRSERSKPASTRRSSSVSSVDTIRAGQHNAIAVRSADRPLIAEAPGDGFRLRSSRSRKSRDDDNLSVHSYHDDDGSDVTVVRPDPTEVSVVGPASTPYDQQKQQQSLQQWQDQQKQYRQQQQQQRYRPQPYTQPYQQPHQQPYPQPHPQQYQQQAPYPAYGTPVGHPQYTNHQHPFQQHPNPRYTHPPPTAQSYYPPADARYPSPYVTPTPQYGTGYERLGEELEQGRRSGRLPKARDKRREKVERPRRTARLEEEDEESALVYERGDGGKFPKKWFD